MINAHVHLLILLIFTATLPAAFAKEREAERQKAEQNRLGNVAIQFFGRVVDQSNHSITGAIVRLEIRVNQMVSLSAGDTRWKKVELITDDKGEFFLEEKGGGVTISEIKKEGYLLSSNASLRFEYFHSHMKIHHVSDPQNPVIFKMWKLQGAEPMVFQAKRIRIPYSGTPVFFDFINGSKVEDSDQGADIRVTLLRTPLEITERQKFDWQATIEAIGGGLIETRDEFMYLAPAHGYQPRIEIRVSANAPNWSPDRKVSFYIHNREGKHFGRVTLEFNTWSTQPTTGFGFTSFINPDGSRNLEYDVFKQVAPETLRKSAPKSKQK